MNLNPLDKSGFTMAVSVLWRKITDKLSALSKVAYSGKYIDLTGRPTKLSEFQNDVGFKTIDTTYGVVSKTANGLAPKLPNETTTTKYLRQDGTWQTPPDTNTTYGAATQSAAGLMSAADKKKLDGFKGIANNDTTTEAGFAWDARRGKALREDVDKLNSALGTDFKNTYTYVLQTNTNSFSNAIVGSSVSNTTGNTLDSLHKNIDSHNTGIYNYSGPYFIILLKNNNKNYCGVLICSYMKEVGSYGLPVYFSYVDNGSSTSYTVFAPRKNN